jgi:cold shock CspA family protein/ribosome-associated translation inhibitor RaiA
MQIPLEISYRGVDKSEKTDALVRTKAQHLDKFCDRISRCDVVIEQPNHAQHSGNPFRVRIDVTIPPGHELVSDERPVKHEMHEPLSKVINDAFKHMERQVKDLVQKQRLDVKHHPETHALITKLFPDEGYGFITDLQGRDVYFHRHTLVNGEFENLKVGAEVRFVETHGEKGPQATTVQIVSTGGSRI